MDNNSILFQAMVYLAAAVVMVPLAKRLGLGSVLGYLLAGILIGPTVLQFIGTEGQDLMHSAEFGVVMMLFLIGLELEPALLWKLRKAILGLGGLQVLITSIIISAIAYFLKLPWQSSLAIGMALALSSTALVLQTLAEKGINRTTAGRSAFAVLLFQDIAVIPMLAFFPLLAIAGLTPADVSVNEAEGWIESQSGWMRALIVSGAIGFIIIGGRYLIPPIFRLVAATQLREMFTATALLLVVGIAVLMSSVGLSPALGTFLSGVVLANSEYKHELESDIEPFKGLLLGLFFIAVGASINFELIMNQPLLIFGLVLALMFVKAVVLLVLGKIFKLRVDQNIIFSSSLSQVGEFAFVLLSFSLTEGIVERGYVEVLMAVVAISMALTPIAFFLNEKIVLPFIDKRLSSNKTEKEADAVNEKNPVIIAGFGHFGNTIGRFLRAHGVKTTVLDIDSNRVEFLRKMGFKVYYGDASRYDILLAAGAAEAKMIIIAVDDPEKRLQMIETIKKHFPDLQMLVRSSTREDTYDQMNAGILHIYRETIDTSLRMGVDAMKILGHRAYTAQRAARTFFRYDEQKLKDLSKLRDNEKEYINQAREYIEELEEIIKADTKQLHLVKDLGWDEDSLIADEQVKKDE
ncbi:monovalent cation:proton antiporter-2 (CPA2) family protein [Lacibacter sp.]|uniref:monovalent cation:proton antiporter-2 (CPA2) family protein n=1 Tax=Lacibacter sp. TaxID=1915409 RepID=UPI002B4B1415|nr:monovalent cation:proton antiporter-2 (CPA2) family protein [Lacibacter sp.]HLP38017.1 monovalent cation:proton antiporter-2 (CPA2) family protein [Lacibacter sp.]